MQRSRDVDEIDPAGRQLIGCTGEGWPQSTLQVLVPGPFPQPER